LKPAAFPGRLAGRQGTVSGESRRIIVLPKRGSNTFKTKHGFPGYLMAILVRSRKSVSSLSYFLLTVAKGFTSSGLFFARICETLRTTPTA
jgi:hypothetical protein